MNGRTSGGGGAGVPGVARAGVRSGGGPARTGLGGLLGGAVLGACLIGAGGAQAYEQFSGTEGGQIEIRYSLPTFPHEARRHSPGYSGVRYNFCTKDGTATGAPWAQLFGGGDVDPEADYIRACGFKWTLKSNNNYNKQLILKYNTRHDDRAEGNEYFWLYLTQPEVRRPGSDVWQSHGGSHHVPSRIAIQLTIEDND